MPVSSAKLDERIGPRWVGPTAILRTASPITVERPGRRRRGAGAGGTCELDLELPGGFFVAADFACCATTSWRGYSDRPKVSYNRTLYERQLGELVDHLGLQAPFHLVGLSMGGATAVNFTARQPGRVRRLVLIAPVVNNFKVPPILRLPGVGELVLRLAGLRFMRKRFAELAETLPDFMRYQKLFVAQTAYEGFRFSP